MTKTKAKLSQKVYEVQTGLHAIKSEAEIVNWSKYTVVARDAEMAISFAKVRFRMAREYIWQVTFITELDE